MLEVKIENLTFPREIVETILIGRDNRIKIDLLDNTKGKYRKDFEKWINLSGTLDQKTVELVTIGKHHFEDQKFKFISRPQPGVAGKTPDRLVIVLDLIPEKGL